MNEYTISRHTSGRLYAYFKGRFWRWDEAQDIWRESHLMHQKYVRSQNDGDTMDPQDFLNTPEVFEPLDEYEVPCGCIDALKNAKPCKNAPIDPVEEESEWDTAPNAAVAATTNDLAVESEAGIPTTSESEADASESTPEKSPQSCESAPAALAGASSALPSSATDGNLQDKPLTFIREDKCPAFDYSGLADQTVENLHFAEDEYRHGKQMAERGLIHMGNAIATAHDELCSTAVAQCDNGRFAKKEDTFRAWCLSIGITKDSAYRLLQVSALLAGSSPRQRAILEALPPTLLYAVAKPSAPQELVEKVKNGEVASNKEYQALLKENQQLRTDRVNAMNQADREKARADRAEHQLEATQADVAGLKERADAAEAREEEAWKMQSKSEQRAMDAEKQLDGARRLAEASKMRGDKLKAENEALKKQPITAVVDEEEVDKRAKALAHQWDEEELDKLAAEKTWGLADARNAELAKDNANLKKQLTALRSRINDDAQADFEQANYCASLMRAAWDNSKASYSRLVGEDLESTFQTICATLNSIREEASLLCRQPPDYDGGDRDE